MRLLLSLAVCVGLHASPAVGGDGRVSENRWPLANAVTAANDFAWRLARTASEGAKGDVLLTPFATASALAKRLRTTKGPEVGLIESLLGIPAGAKSGPEAYDALRQGLQLDEEKAKRAYSTAGEDEFRGPWEEPFGVEGTKLQTFHGSRGDVRHSFMRHASLFDVARSTEWHAIDLDLRGGDYALTIVMAATGPARLTKMSGPSWRDLVSKFKSESVLLQLPVVAIDSQVDSVALVKSLGVKTFDGQTRSKTLALNETGVSVPILKDDPALGALTHGVSVKPPAPFVVDRPFLVLIRHKRSGLLTMMAEIDASVSAR